MTDGAGAVGSSLESFEEAALNAFGDIPGDPDRRGLVSASVARMWLTKGGVVGVPQFHVELQADDRLSQEGK